MITTLYEFIVVTTGIVAIAAIVGITFIARRAYYTGSAPGAPEAFTAFASQLLRITAVILIIGATIFLAYPSGDLKSSVTGILSGIAGYVLGSSEKTPKLKQSDANTNQETQEKKTK